MTRSSAATVDLILLGMVFEQPRSAYEMQKLVEYRNLSRWVPISAPTVYKNVLRLAERGYLKSETVREGKMPEKAVYSITESGRSHFYALMRRNAAAEVNVIFAFNAVIANLGKVPPDKARALLLDIRQSIAASRAFIEQTLPERREVTRPGTAIMEQQSGVLSYLLEWLDGYRAGLGLGEDAPLSPPEGEGATESE